MRPVDLAHLLLLDIEPHGFVEITVPLEVAQPPVDDLDRSRLLFFLKDKRGECGSRTDEVCRHLLHGLAQGHLPHRRRETAVFDQGVCQGLPGVLHRVVLVVEPVGVG